MKNSDDTAEKSSISVWLLIVGVLVFAYVLSTGPVTRWSPRVADTIYAPLCPLAKNNVLGSPLRTWLRLWGVAEPLLTRSYFISADTFVRKLKQLAPPKSGESNQDLLTRFFKDKHIEIHAPAAVLLVEKKDRLLVRTTQADQDKIEILVQEIVNAK